MQTCVFHFEISNEICAYTSRESKGCFALVAVRYSPGPGVVPPVRFLHKATRLPSLLGLGQPPAVVVQPLVVRSVTGLDAGRLRAAACFQRHWFTSSAPANLTTFNQRFLRAFTAPSPPSQTCAEICPRRLKVTLIDFFSNLCKCAI